MVMAMLAWPRRSLTTLAGMPAVGELEQPAGSKAPRGRALGPGSVADARRKGQGRQVERLCRKVLGTDLRELYGEAFAGAWQHRASGIERASTGLRPLLLLAQERVAAGRRRQPRRADERCAVVRPEVVLKSWTVTAQSARTRWRWPGTSRRAAPVSRWWWGGPGSGETWALGLAQEAFELDGYQVVGAAPTGIATVGLAEEGFADARTIDRLLLDLGRGQLELDARTVLVVDEGAMVSTRKLAPCSSMPSVQGQGGAGRR